jgi:hypothetical protein
VARYGEINDDLSHAATGFAHDKPRTGSIAVAFSNFRK